MTNPLEPFHVAVPLFNQLKVALNCCPGDTVDGTDCDTNWELYPVPGLLTTMDKAFCALPEAESST